MTRTAWRDAATALRARIDSFPSQAHPAVRTLIRKYESLLQYGLQHEYITPEEAART
ncbi:hypothetical protein [Streptomyces sp. AC495_CC817]|uniref:hypothetical protein n=1 Tax=Streptomyces sp. AC495_CC817 TaxID=2823900 RepID=UPI001C25ADB6|nr:hypothetical protein [Streptomyces sp. AC495_CC817]